MVAFRDAVVHLTATMVSDGRALEGGNLGLGESRGLAG